MSNPEDPRERTGDRPWEDGTSNPPTDRPDGDQPTEAWQQYPDQQPYPDQQQYPDQQNATQQFPTQQNPGPQGYQQYPDSQPYPDQPTQQYGYPQQPYGQGQYGQGQYDQGQYGQYGQQPNPTQALPPYDPNQHQAANNQYAAGQPYTAAQPYDQAGASGAPVAEDDPKNGGSSKKWIFAAVAMAALAVVVLAGVLFVTNQKPEPSTTAIRPPSTSLAPLPTLPPSQSPLVPPTTPGGLVPGGIPEILGGAGAAIGTITAIDGTTLSLEGIDGAPVTIVVTPQTQILSLSGFDVASLKVGSLVVVNGSPMQDGTITADVIVETPDLGG